MSLGDGALWSSGSAMSSGVWSRQSTPDSAPGSFLSVRGRVRGRDKSPKPEPPCLAFPGAVYGGDYPMTDMPLKMKVPCATKGHLRPMQWINRVAKKLLMLDELILEPDGGFRRPGAAKQTFPRHGVNLKWRLDAAKDCIVVDFFKHGQYLPWRHDVIHFTIDEELANDDGVPVSRGKFTGRLSYYCGRSLGTGAIPGSDGRCGPYIGPQCQSCVRFGQSCGSVVDSSCQSCTAETSYLSCVGTSGRFSWNYELRPEGAAGSDGHQSALRLMSWSDNTDFGSMSTMGTLDSTTEALTVLSSCSEDGNDSSGEGDVNSAIERGLARQRQGRAHYELQAPEDYVWGGPMKRIETPPENRVRRNSPVDLGGRSASSSPDIRPSEEPLRVLGERLTAVPHSPRDDGRSSPRGGGPGLWKKMTSWGCCVTLKKCCSRRRPAGHAHHHARETSGGGTGEAPASASEGGGVRSTLRRWRLGAWNRAGRDPPVWRMTGPGEAKLLNDSQAMAQKENVENNGGWA